MGWSIVSAPKVVPVTIKLAQAWTELQSINQDRPLSTRRLVAYRKMLYAGKFRPVTWAKCFCRADQITYRMNGQHTSALFSQQETIAKDSLYAYLEEYLCDEPSDLSDLYSTFDSKLQIRNANDIYNAYASTVPELKTVARTMVGRIISGLAYYKSPTTGGGNPDTLLSDRAELIYDFVPFTLWANTVLAHPNSRRLTKASVIAAMLHTWNVSAAKSTEFWIDVRDELGESIEVPARKLSIYLREQSGSDRRATLCKCITAWNAWRTGKATNLKYHPDAKVPKAI